MSARTIAALALVLAHTPAAARPGVKPAALAAACKGRDGWADPAPAATLFGNVHFVGTCGITALLITDRRGHVLIDTGPAEAAPLVAANIRQLGFRLRDVRFILTSHEHLDHVGGLAALRRRTGAQVVALAAQQPQLESGKPAADDPQRTIIAPFAPVPVGRTIADGETIRAGNMVLTAHATPGHTDGSTTWSWRSCAGGDCATIVYADSLSAVSADDYRFSDHPDRVAKFRQTFARVGRLPCDILLTPHPAASDMLERAAQGRLRAPGQCIAYARHADEALTARLQKERNKRGE